MDSISDMITRMWNASKAGKESFSVPYSKMKFAVAELLVKEKFLKSVNKRGKKVVKYLDMELLYDGKKPKINGLKRVSKPSRRIYQGARDLKLVRQGYGRLVLSTPQGLMTNHEARRQKVGGEALFKIW